MWLNDPWSGSWGHAWAGSWGLTFEAAQDEEVLHGGGSGSEEVKRKKKQPIRNTQEKDLMEVLTIIMATGILCR